MKAILKIKTTRSPYELSKKVVLKLKHKPSIGEILIHEFKHSKQSFKVTYITYEKDEMIVWCDLIYKKYKEDY